MAWKVPVFVCLLVLLTGCGGGEDNSGSSGKDGARRISLKLTHKPGRVMIEEHREVSTQDMMLDDTPMLEKETKVKVKRTEILEVNDAGEITRARVSWDKSEASQQKNKHGTDELGEPQTIKSGLQTAKILYTRGAEGFESKLEGGDAESSSVRNELNEKEPFLIPFIPGREVAVDETWDIDPEVLKRKFGTTDKMSIGTLSGKAKADKIVEKDGKELLRVTFTMKTTGKLLDESLNNPPFTSDLNGEYFWDIENSVPVSVKMTRTMNFSTKAKLFGDKESEITVDGLYETEIQYHFE